MRGDKKEGLRQNAALFLLWLVFTLCYGYGLIQADNAARLHRGTTVVLEGELSASEGEEISSRENEEEAPVDFALWSERPGEVLADTAGRVRLPAAVMTSYGSVRLACQDGSAPDFLSGDGEGCLLSADLAWELFGSDNVVGQAVFCRNRRVTIRGILRRGRGRIVLPTEKNAAEPMNRLTIGSTGAEADAFLLRHGLNGKKLSLEYAAMAAKLAAWFLLLFSGLYPLCGLWRLRGKAGSKTLAVFFSPGTDVSVPADEKAPCGGDAMGAEVPFRVRYPRIRVLVRRLWAMAAAGVFLWILLPAMGWGSRFSVHELLPTKWSDLAFWSRKVEEMAASVGFLFGCAKTEGEQMALSAAAAGLFFLLLSLLFYRGTVKRLGRAPAGILALLTLLHWAVLAGLSVRFGEAGSVLAAHRGLWLVLPLGLVYWRVYKWAS